MSPIFKTFEEEEEAFGRRGQILLSFNLDFCDHTYSVNNNNVKEPNDPSLSFQPVWWLDADTITGADREALSLWSDISGNGYDLNPPQGGGSQDVPLLKTAVVGLNGHKGVVCDTSPSSMDLIPAGSRVQLGRSGGVDGSEGITAFFVYRTADALDSVSELMVGSQSGGNKHSLMTPGTSDSLSRFTIQEGGSDTILSFNPIGQDLGGGEWHIGTFRCPSNGGVPSPSNNTWIVTLDGVDESALINLPVNIIVDQIFETHGTATENARAGVGLAYMVLYKGDLGTDDHDAVYNFLAQRFGFPEKSIGKAPVSLCEATDLALLETPRSSGCEYSFSTCQDVANFAPVERAVDFCLESIPWTDFLSSAAPHPSIVRFIDLPQKIAPGRLFNFPETITVQMKKDYRPTPHQFIKSKVDEDGTEKFNDTELGEFWQNILARHRNLFGTTITVKRGFAPIKVGEVMQESQFQRVGPDYTISKVSIGDTTISIEARSPLFDLTKKKIPSITSDDNVLLTNALVGQDFLDVNDVSEFPDPNIKDRLSGKIYVEIENEMEGNEICRVVSIEEDINRLNVERGALSTSEVNHIANQALQVKHVVYFGTINPVNGRLEDDTLENVVLDILEWTDIPVATVDNVEDGTIDTISTGIWPRPLLRRLLKKTKPVARLLQDIREDHGIMIYLTNNGQWAFDIMAPNGSDVTSLDDGDFVENTTKIVIDDEDRVTRVSLFYDPSDPTKASKEPTDYERQVKVVNIELESDNVFKDSKERTILSPWISPSAKVADVRLLATRIIARLRYGTRTFRGTVDAIHGTLNVGDSISYKSEKVLNTRGLPDTRPGVVIAKKMKGAGRSELEIYDTNYSGRYARIGPNTMAQKYEDATDEDKNDGCYMGDDNNRVGNGFDEGYIFF